MANLFTPAIKALKEWQKGLPERQKNRNWGRTESYAEQCKLLPSVEAVAKLEDAEQVKALKELCEALPKGKGRSSAVCSPAFLTEWINKLGVALMGQLPEETLMNESFKMVLVLEDVVMETAQSWQGADRHGKELVVTKTWTEKAPWRTLGLKYPAVLATALEMMPAGSLGQYAHGLKLEDQKKVVKVLEGKLACVLDFKKDFGPNNQSYLNRGGQVDLPDKLQAAWEEVLNNTLAKISPEQVKKYGIDFGTYHLERYAAASKKSWELADTTKLHLLTQSTEAKNEPDVRWQYLNFLLEAGNLSEGELGALHKHPLIVNGKNHANWSYRYGPTVWWKMLLHSHTNLEQAKGLLQSMGTWFKMTWGEIETMTNKFPQLLFEPRIVANMEAQREWVSIFKGPVAKDLEVAKKVLDKIMTGKQGLSQLFKALEQQPLRIAEMPWELILTHPRLKRATTRFRLQAMAARAKGGAIEGVDPLADIKLRIKRTKSGNSAYGLLKELSKDQGVLFQYIEGSLILRLFKLAELTAPQFESEHWGTLATLRNIKVSGEETARLIPEAMRLYLRDHYKFKTDHRHGGASGMMWAMPPLTPSSELPQILINLPPAMRVTLMNQLYETRYVTSETLLDKAGLEKEMNALGAQTQQKAGPVEGQLQPEGVKPESVKLKVGAR